MGKWTTRKDNRRRLAQAANLLDNAVRQIIYIEQSFPDAYPDDKELLTKLGVAIGDLREGIMTYRDTL